MAWVSGVAGDGHLGQSLKAALSPAMGHGGSETTLKCAQLVTGTQPALSPPWTDVPPALGAPWREAPKASAAVVFVDTKRADPMEFSLQAPGALPRLVPFFLARSLFFPFKFQKQLS